MAAKKLTAKQQKFIEAYLINLNASEAALKAGYSPKTAPFIGAENLKKPQIAEAIAKAQRKVSEKMEITLDDCLRGLHGIAENDEAPAAARTSAWTTLAKMCGHFVEQRKITHDGEVAHKHRLSDTTVDKLKEIYEAGQQEAGA